MSKRKLENHNFRNNKRIMNNKVNSILDSLIEILSSITYNSTLFVNSKFKVIGNGSYSSVYSVDNSNEIVAVKLFKNDEIPVINRKSSTLQEYLKVYPNSSICFDDKLNSIFKNELTINNLDLKQLYNIFQHLTLYIVLTCGFLPKNLIDKKVSVDNFYLIRNCIKEYVVISLLNKRIDSTSQLKQIKRNLLECNYCNISVDETNHNNSDSDITSNNNEINKTSESNKTSETSDYDKIQGFISYSYYKMNLSQWFIKNIELKENPDFLMLNKIMFQIFVTISLLEKVNNNEENDENAQRFESIFAHRDLKPDNIMIDTNIRTLKYNINNIEYELKDTVVVKICDFSLSIIKMPELIIDSYDEGAPPKIGLDLTMFLIFILYQFNKIIYNLSSVNQDCKEFLYFIKDWSLQMNRNCFKIETIKDIVKNYKIFRRDFANIIIPDNPTNFILNPLEHSYFSKFMIDK